MPPILEAMSLTKRYHDFTLREITFELPRGCIVGFFGPIGAGKTTLMKLLAHQIPASSGTVRILGLNYQEHEQEIKSRIGYVAQEPCFYRDRSVSFNARFAASFFEHWDGGLFYKLLDEFRISREKAVKHLSRGQKTLLSIALALAHESDLLILDEPTAGLDVVLRRAILDRLRQYVADGERTILLSSHITDGLDEIVEYVHFLNEGRWVLQAQKDEMLAQWKWIHFKDGALDPELVRQFAEVRKQPFSNSGLTRDFSALREQIAAGMALGDVKVENARLDDILVAIMKGA